MDSKKLALMLTPTERKVLSVLENHTVKELEELTKLSETEVIRALQWLQNKKLATVHKEEKEHIVLGKLGKEYLKKKLPELQMLKVIKDGIELNELFNKGLDKQEVNVGIGKLREYSAISLEKKDGKTYVKRLEQAKRLSEKGTLEQQFLEKLPLETASLNNEDKNAFQKLRKRGGIIEVETKKIITGTKSPLGKTILQEDVKKELAERLTPHMLKDGSWKKKTFRHYDVEINVPEITGGRKHPVEEVKEFVKSIWVEMGFKEMKGPLLEESFWNFDALFIPQDHPAREMQDALFSDLKLDVNKIKQYNAVKKENLKNWRIWDDEKPKKLVLRTHTTNLSARTIGSLKKTELPGKFFSVGKVFRNETLDWSHLFEFYQVEGIVVDPDVTFNDLVGYLKTFFGKMGFDQIRIRPGYFPYTEPSVEVEVFHPKKKKWLELGGAGIFRPELVKPLLGVDVPVLAWGLGLERIMMDYYELDNIREVYKNDLKTLQKLKMWVR